MFHEVRGILPGCRKAVKLTFSPMYSTVWVQPLFGYNGKANIRPEDWKKLVLLSPVVSRYKDFTLTPEIIEDAYSDALSIVTCETATNPTQVSPDYKPKYDEMVTL